MPVTLKSTVLPIGLLFFVMVGCASSPEIQAPEPVETRSADVAERPADVGERAADYAAQLVGRPYRYGGSRPSTGFDCSGLVQYSYARAGRKLPRSTDDQRVAALRIRLSDLRRGDLVFFDQEGKKHGHVGIYVGKGEFVHAPSSGKRVRRDRLDGPYWSRHISEVRRPNG
jgi:cell wall-associated NlpC family hydrolase